MEARYLQLGLGPRHGFVTDLSRRSGVLRGTMTAWFSRSAAPRLDALGAIAEVLKVSRADLVAAFDGTVLGARAEPVVISDAIRRRRRKWWLRIGRETTPLGLTEAQDASIQRGFRASISSFEDPRNAAQPSEGQLRALGEIYRIPTHRWIDLWNNPPDTDEEAIAALRARPIEEVPAIAREEPERPARRRTA